MGGFPFQSTFLPVLWGCPCAGERTMEAARTYLVVLPKFAEPKRQLHSRLVVGKFREIWGFPSSLELLSDVLPTFQQEAPKRIPPLACDKLSAPTVHLLAKRRGKGWENHSSIFLFKWKHFLVIVIKKRGCPSVRETLHHPFGWKCTYSISLQERGLHL